MINTALFSSMKSKINDSKHKIAHHHYVTNSAWLSWQWSVQQKVKEANLQLCGITLISRKQSESIKQWAITVGPIREHRDTFLPLYWNTGVVPQQRQ